MTRTPFRTQRFASAVAFFAFLLGAPLAQAQTSPGYRYINFKGQTEPTAVPATLVSNDGSVTMNVTGAAATGFFQGYNETPTPAPFVGANLAQNYISVGEVGTGTLSFTLGSGVVAQDALIGDQAVRTTSYLSGDCMNAAGTALEACDFSAYPTYNEVRPLAVNYCGQILTAWNIGTSELQAYTTDCGYGASSQGVKLYVKLPASLRVLRIRHSVVGQGDFNIRGLAVADAPAVTKAFAPAAVAAGGESTLTITVNNPIVPTTGVPNVNVTDVLPAPLELVGGVSSNTCGGTVTAPAGGNTLQLVAGALPVGDGCTITAQVRWPNNAAGIAACTAGTPLTNTIAPTTQFTTAYGQMNTPATATLSCSGVTPPGGGNVTAVPAQTPAGLALLSLGLGFLVWRTRKRNG